jgi:non-homologous end joining protein Ku
MKLGRYIPLGDYKNVKVGYGTINHKELKTIYVNFNSWLEPDPYCEDYDVIVKSSRNKIKKLIYNLGIGLFRKESIVDLDVRTKGIKKEKRSFMNLEITLYTEKHFNIKDKSLKDDMYNLVTEVIDTCLNDDLLYNFNKKKK